MPSGVLYHLPDGVPNIRAHGSLQDLLAVTPIHFAESHMAKSTITHWNALDPENLDAGHYASRLPGELHGPFRTDIGCVVLEVSFPNRIRDTNVAQPIILPAAAR